MVPDFFTEQFTAGLDLVGQTLTWEPSGTNDFYALCGEPAAGLPTDPAGGTILALADDQPDSFMLTGGATVALYGQGYDTVFVGPNGYLTFGSGDSAYNESFATHFSLPRVAALFDDLNPSTGGTVSWKQAADRVAVTWQDVPEYSTSNANTFQIEMFFDGTIRITWVAIAVQDAIAGLSAGNGLDPDFLASDLSAGSGCGPRPPVVQNLSVMTGVDTPQQVTLVGLDDGLPGPLSYRLLRLPTYGTLTDDGTAQPIGSVPHDLQPGASSVTYTPASGMQGYDSFDYAADDGGTAPGGGSSAAGLVGVTVGGESAVYEFLVDDTDPGWSTTGAWAFGSPTGGGSHNLDPTGGATGANVYGYNLSGDYTDNMTEESLTSGPLDLTGVLNTTLEFQRWLGIESSSYDHARVQISTDDTTWTTLWEHNGSALDPNAWTQQILDLSTIADNQPSVRLRWVMGTSDGSVTYPGWNLDDIRINAFTPGACSTPPAEIQGLRVDADATTLRWTPASYSGGTPPVYDLLRSTDGSNFASGATCLAADAAGTTAQDTQDPAAFEVYFYLVRAENNCGEGSIGAGRSGQTCLP
jgi:hypothetical protein